MDRLCIYISFVCHLLLGVSSGNILSQMAIHTHRDNFIRILFIYFLGILKFETDDGLAVALKRFAVNLNVVKLYRYI